MSWLARTPHPRAWIDGAGNLRRVVLDVPRAQPDPRVRMPLELYDFGTPMHGTPPPTDQVTDMKEFFKVLDSS